MLHSYSLMLAMSAFGIVVSIFVMKYNTMLKLPYLHYLNSLTNFPKGSFGQNKLMQYSFQGKLFSS